VEVSDFGKLIGWFGFPAQVKPDDEEPSFLDRVTDLSSALTIN